MKSVGDGRWMVVVVECCSGRRLGVEVETGGNELAYVSAGGQRCM